MFKLNCRWPFRIGLPMLTTAVAWTGWKINSMFRRKLKLHNYGLGATQLALTLTPALLGGSSHIYVLVLHSFKNFLLLLNCQTIFKKYYFLFFFSSLSHMIYFSSEQSVNCAFNNEQFISNLVLELLILWSCLQLQILWLKKIHLSVLKIINYYC